MAVVKVGIALIRPLAWELPYVPYAMGTDLKGKNKQTNKQKNLTIKIKIITFKTASLVEDKLTIIPTKCDYE